MRITRLLLIGVVTACDAFDAGTTTPPADAGPSAEDHTAPDAGADAAGNADAAPAAPFCKRQQEGSLCVDFEDGLIPSGWLVDGETNLEIEAPGFESALSLRAGVKTGPTAGSSIAQTVPFTTGNTSLELDVQLDDASATVPLYLAAVNFARLAGSTTTIVHLGFVGGHLFVSTDSTKSMAARPFPQKKWVHIAFKAAWNGGTVNITVGTTEDAGSITATYATISRGQDGVVGIGLRTDTALDRDVSVHIDDFVARVE